MGVGVHTVEVSLGSDVFHGGQVMVGHADYTVVARVVVEGERVLPQQVQVTLELAGTPHGGVVLPLGVVGQRVTPTRGAQTGRAECRVVKGRIWHE